MEKFATNISGNIDSGTEVLANNMVYLQQAKENAISNLYGDLFTEGILNINMGTTANPVEPFELKAGSVAGTFSVGVGIAYKKDVNTNINERIAILEESPYHDEPFGDSTYPDGRGVNQKTFDGVDNYVATPKSSGCQNIPITSAGVTYYVDLRYINVCDNNNSGDGLNLTNFSIAKNQVVNSPDQRKRFYKWTDGYNIVLITNLSQRQGVILGTVQKDNSNNLTFTQNGRDNNLLVASNVFMDYFVEGSGITIIEEDDKKKLAINVDNTTTEIENNKIKVTKDGLYPYTKFAMNSGPENIFGTDLTNVFLSLPENVKLWLSPAYNDRYSVDSTITIGSIDVWALAQTQFSGQAGTYVICINNTDKNNNNIALTTPKLELMNKIRIGKVTEISTQNTFDILVDLTTQPYQTKWYDGGQWQVYHGVPLGEVTISGGTITNLKQFDYNTNFVESKVYTSTIYVDHQAAYNAVLSTVSAGTTPTASSYPYAFKMIDKDNNLLGSIEYQLLQEGKYGIGIVAKKWGESLYAALQLGYNISSGKPYLMFDYNPIPRLPDYSTRTQVASSTNNDVASWTATGDGWVEADLIGAASSGGDDSVFSINNNAIYNHASNGLPAGIGGGVGVVVIGIYPVKKGDVIRVRRGIKAFFYSYR